jgi:hypothetical protein
MLHALQKYYQVGITANSQQFSEAANDERFALAA